MDNITVGQLAHHIGARLVGDEKKQIRGVNAIEAADETELTFLSDEAQVEKLQKSRCGAVIVVKEIEALQMPQLIVKNVDAGLIAALQVFAPKLAAPQAGVHSTAVVDAGAEIDRSACIGPAVYVAPKARIGANTVISSGCKIGENSKIGDNCRLDSNVVVYHNCTIGNNVIIQANTTVGSTGFGYSFIDGQHRLIPHHGGVIIQDFVEIGANCCIDRAKFGNTIIGAGTKIDNLVQVAHNVIIGKCCLIAGLVGIAGSCKLGDGVVLAGQVGLADHITIGDGAIIGARAGVMNDIPPGRQVLGSPAIDKKEAVRVVTLTLRLPEMAKQLKQLAEKVEKLQK